MKKVLSVLLLGAMLLATLASCGGDGDSTSTTAAGTTKAPSTTTTNNVVVTTPAPDDLEGEENTEPETPMELAEVESWMESHTMLNDKVSPDGFFSSGVGVFADGRLANLFDKVYSAADWQAASEVGEDGLTDFERATVTNEVDTNGDGIIGDGDGDGVDDDKWIELGKFGFMGNSGTFYWAMTEKVTLGSYVIYTGNDNSTYPNRNPVGWQIYGTNDASLAAIPEDITPSGTSSMVLNDKESLLEAGWVCLDDVYDGNMADADFTPFGYKIDDEKQGAYQYYCWRIDYGGDDTSLIQCTGMKLFAAE